MSIQQVIEDKLRATFSPPILNVENESHMHNVPPRSETHFKVTLVTQDFDGLRSVKRHQLVYQVLTEELQSGVHALALHTYTPEEWRGDAPASPQCAGS